MSLVHAGKFLRVDLTDGHWREERIADETVRNYLLGSGLAAKLYYDEIDPAIAPLDPDNPLYVFNGLLTGTFSPTGCRSTWCGRSPLTGIWGESNTGGFFGPELRFAGYDGIVVTGQSERPVWLSIVDGQAQLCDASDLWGSDSYATQERVREAMGKPKARVACIGQAGENVI